MAIRDREVIDEFKQSHAQGGGRQVGGGPGPADQDAAGGSSGSGGYGNAQNQAFEQDRSDAPETDRARPNRRELSRGERYDVENNGGRGPDSVDFPPELKEDQQDHQDRGQRWVDDDGELDEGAVTEGQQP